MADAAVLEAPTAPVAPVTETAPAEPAASLWVADPNLSDPEPAPAAVPAAPAPEAPPVQAEAPVEAAPVAPEPPAVDAVSAGAAEAPVAPDWKARLDARDPDLLKELLSHPVLAGHIGTHADRLAQQKQDAAARAARDAELDEHARANPEDPLAQERLARRQAELQAISEAQAATNAFQAAYSGVVAFVQTLPAETKAELARIAPEGKAYGQPGDLASGLSGYMADVAAAAAAAAKAQAQAEASEALAKAKAEWEKTELPAKFKDYLAARGETEPSPDMGTNALPSNGGSGLLTLAQYTRMTPEQAAELSGAEIDAMYARHAAQAAARS